MSCFLWRRKLIFESKILFCPCRDGERLTIELGRALRNGEYKCKVHYLKLSENIDEMEKMPFLCDWILCNGASIGKTKREILAHISTIEPKYEIAYERCRLRKLNLRSPGKVYVDDQRFSEYDGLTSDMQVSHRHTQLVDLSKF